MTVSIVIPTFGDVGVWGPLADRAEASARRQTVVSEVVRVYGTSLAAARNRGAQRASGEHLIFLDADDELDPRYVEAMLGGTADLRQPATLGIVDGHEDDSGPVVIAQRPLLEGNFLVIGTMVRRDAVLAVGGFREWPAWEDWDLFVRLWLEGATIEAIPDAVYRVHVRPGSRNDLGRAEALALWESMTAEYRAAARAKGLV